MGRDTLDEAAEYVRREFFPRWDPKRHWRVVNDSRREPGVGHCRSRSRQIAVNPDGLTYDEIVELLVHEVCHAVAVDNHSERWWSRMHKAADRATEMGLGQLASAIRENAGQPEEESQISMRAAAVYEEIRDAVDCQPECSYETIVRGAASSRGCFSEELEQDFPMCRRVYDASKRDYERMKRARQKLFLPKTSSGPCEAR